jgi:16S rRNA (cytosine1402-N4)-methyltransferase
MRRCNGCIDAGLLARFNNHCVIASHIVNAEVKPFAHIPVMPDQVMALLAPRSGETAVDLTVGLGGHAILLSRAVGQKGTVVGFDLDADTLRAAEANLRACGDASVDASRGDQGGACGEADAARFVPVHASFTDVAERLRSLDLRADVILADLGFSSVQMDDPSRGFSFTADGPLDMRLDRSQSVTAADLLAALSEKELADLIYHSGEDPFARRIARKLAQIRRREPIRTTARLAELVVEAYGPRARSSRMHPATRTFMALRIAVNDELGSLRTLLQVISRGAEEASRGGWMRDGARIAIISFHSLEDRLVKHAFAELCWKNLAARLTRKPLTPGQAEVQANPRARSAKLRAIRIGPADRERS